MENKFEKLKVIVREFTKERDWEKFHSPKNLIMSLFKEIGELSEIFQWKKEESSFKNNFELGFIDLYMFSIKEI